MDKQTAGFPADALLRHMITRAELAKVGQLTFGVWEEQHAGNTDRDAAG